MKNDMHGRDGWMERLAKGFGPLQAQAVAAMVLAGLLAAWPCRTQAAPIASTQAVAAVTAWLAADNTPMNTSLSKTIGDVMAYPGADGITNAFYVVSLLPQGYVIVAADDLAGSVISFSATGAFNPAPNSSFYHLLQVDLPQRVAYAQSQQAQGKQAMAVSFPGANPTPMDSGTTNVVHPDPATGICRVRVAPMIMSHWSQNEPYNYYTPSNAQPGIVAVCLAEIIRHFQWPPNGIGRALYLDTVNESPQWLWTGGGDGFGGPYQWSNMVDDATASGVTLTQQQAVAELCADVGIAVAHEHYDVRHTTDEYSTAPWGWMPDGTPFTMADGLHNVYAFTNGGFLQQYSGIDPLWIGDENLKLSPASGGALGMINANLDAGFPVLLTLWQTAPLGSTMICDGYGYSLGVGSVNGEPVHPQNWMFHHINLADGNSGDDIWYTLPAVQGGKGYTNILAIGFNMMPTNSGEIVSGRVVDQDEISMPGITMQITDGAGYTNTTVTALTGIYSFIVPANADYTVSVVTNVGGPVVWPTTNPPSEARTVHVGASTMWGACGNVWGVNFEVTSHLVGGQFTKNGVPLIGAEVIFSNVVTLSTNPLLQATNYLLTLQTDLNGSFAIPVPSHWSGTLTPWMAIGGLFSPPFTNLTDVTGNNTNIDFAWTAPTMFAVSGTIFRDDVDPMIGQPNVTVSFSGVGVSAMSDSNGDYIAYVPTNWSGTATASHPDGGIFFPSSRSYTNLSSSTNFQFYYWTAPSTNTISGRIIRRDTGAPVSGATLTTSDGETVTTDANGYYAITVPYLWSGAITASDPEGGAFLPASRIYSSVNTSLSGQNYLWTPSPPAISGYVTRSDAPYGPVSGVTITFSGGFKVQTAADGSYRKALPFGWSGIITPSHPAGGFFIPTNSAYISNLSGDMVQSFSWTPPIQAISGRVTRVGSGFPVVGATVTFINEQFYTDTNGVVHGSPFMPVVNNGANGNAQTDSNGVYSLVVPYGWSGATVPSDPLGGGFSPNQYAFFNNANTYVGYVYNNYDSRTALLSSYDFTWSPPQPVINGHVTRGDGNYGGVAGVTITFSGGVGTALTASDGGYTMSVPFGWIGTATPSHPAGGVFTPSSMPTLNTLTNDVTTQNYSWYPPMLTFSGRVTNINNTQPVAGVTVTFSNAVVSSSVPMIGGGSPVAVVTDIKGMYGLTVPFGWSGSATPMHPFGGVFTPTEYDVTNLVVNLTSENFTWLPPPPFIMGRVVRSDTGAGVSGVSLVFSNSAALVAAGVTNPLAVTITDAGGNYRVIVGTNWSGTVTPFVPGYSGLSFTPAQRLFTNVMDNVLDTNLTQFIYTPAITFLGADASNTLNFGTVLMGKTVRRTIVMKNIGMSICNVLGVAPPASYQALPGSFILNPGGTCAVTVIFAPLAPVTLTGTVVFATLPEPFGGAPSIIVQGAGQDLVDAVSMSTNVDFGTMLVGQSASRSFQFSNHSTIPLTLSAKWSNGTDFSASGFPATIPVDGSKSFTIKFAPKTIKDYGGALLLVSATGVSSSGYIVPTVKVNANVAGTWVTTVNRQNYTLYLRQTNSLVDGIMICKQNAAINDQYVCGINIGTMTGALWKAGSPVGSLSLTASASSLAGTLTRTGIGANVAVKWTRSSASVPASIVFPPRPALLAKPAAAVAATAPLVSSTPTDVLRLTLLDLSPAALLPEDAELVVVQVQNGRPVVVSPALGRYDLSWMLQTRLEADGADANTNGVPDAVEAVLGVPLQDGMQLLIVRKQGGYAVPEAPYTGTTVDGAAVPLSSLPATWSLTPK